MKLMERNKVPFWYCLFDRKEPILDEDGNDTGDQKVFYAEAVPIRANVLFVDKEPEYDAEGQPLYDYIVRRVARSLNVVAYAIRKVSVS